MQVIASLVSPGYACAYMPGHRGLLTFLTGKKTLKNTKQNGRKSEKNYSWKVSAIPTSIIKNHYFYNDAFSIISYYSFLGSTQIKLRGNFGAPNLSDESFFIIYTTRFQHYLATFVFNFGAKSTSMLKKHKKKLT